jgi:hypothetical protein
LKFDDCKILKYEFKIRFWTKLTEFWLATKWMTYVISSLSICPLDLFNLRCKMFLKVNFWTSRDFIMKRIEYNSIDIRWMDTNRFSWVYVLMSSHRKSLKIECVIWTWHWKTMSVICFLWVPEKWLFFISHVEDYFLTFLLFRDIKLILE